MDPRSVLNRPTRSPSEQVRLGTNREPAYDRYDPVDAQSVPRPTVVLIHGGFWRPLYDRAHLRPLAAALADRGHLVFSLEYRGAGGPDSSGWAEIAADVTDGFRAVLNDPRVPADAGLVVVGHSAGAQIALWLAHHADPETIRGVLSLGGCLDLDLADRLDLDDGAVRAAFGAAGDTRAGADPVRLGRCPVAVVALHGEDDAQVPTAVSRSWWEQAGDPGRDQFSVIPGVEHFAPIDPAQPVFATVTAHIETLGGHVDHVE